MGDSTSSTSTSGQQGSASKPPAKLNPEAKDYVPRFVIPEGSFAGNTNQGSSSSNNNRRRRPANKSGNGGKSNNTNTNDTTFTPDSKGKTSNNNRNRRRAPRPSASSGGGRIDDDDDDIEIRMDRPVDMPDSPRPSQFSTLVSSVPTPGSGPEHTGVDAGANRERRRDGRDGRRKGKEADSQPKRREGGENNRSRAPNDGQEASSGRRRNNDNNTSGRDRRHRRKGDLGGRTFPTTTTTGGSDQNTETNRPQRISTPKTRPPAKFVHTVEEDRDLMEALTVGLTNSTYDCMVCWDLIRPAHKTWNCQVCWAAYHLDCISTWAKKSSEDSSVPAAGWRCPGCQNQQVSIPKEYTCFCGKAHNPEFNRYFTPHSCGELCGRSRDCPHPCNIPCHPGPCPPCGGLGPTQYCHCGNESYQLRCADTDFTFQTGKSCNQVCGELLGCGKHSCSSVCHSGLCPPCEEEQVQKCYCGKHERKARCGDGEARTTTIDGAEQTGYYECGDICKRPLACGHHECSKSCHPLDGEPGQCPADPSVVKTCPCGSKTVDVLLHGKQRTSCKDPVPVCKGLCKKPLNCGHRCMQKCHLGECSPCKMVVMIDCRCGSTQVQRVCSDMGLYGDELPSCDRPCRGLRACGKHQCTNRCCPAKNQPKGKKVDLAAHEAHICTLACGKKLQCGIHTCDMLCHKGHCNPCMNTSFHNLSCSCGRTVMQAPIPCGTPIPKCRYTCTRTRSCGHASLTSHPCHPDSEPCPPCIMLVAKQCMCRKSKMPNVPCYQSNPSCGKVCGKKLDCGLHTCIKSCHSGECALPSDACTQACPKARKSCGHRCGVACHGNEPCPEDQPCQVVVPSSCKCGLLTMDGTCNATAENPWDGKPRMIKCNDYCLIAERNRRVALALDIEEGPAPGPRIPEYDAYVLDYASANMEFCLKIEKALAEWVSDVAKPVLYFPPMKGHRRKFVHELAAHYNITSESVDVEPYRSVTIRRLLDTSVPGLLASQACRQKRTGAVMASSMSSSSGVEQLRKPQIRDPVNAIYLHDLAFGLTRAELAAQLAPVFGTIKYGIRWLTDDDAVLVPHPGSMQMDELEAVLVRLRAGIKAVAAKSNLAERVELCWVNREGEVTSHTNVGSNQAKRFFNPSSSQLLMHKAAPPKVVNAFALLDDDERQAAARKAEEERAVRAKEAAGTLSNDAWEEEAAGASSNPTAGVSVSASGETLSQGGSEVEDLTKFVVVEAGEFTDEVVDDWQELLEDDEEVGQKENDDTEGDQKSSEDAPGAGDVGSDQDAPDAKELEDKPESSTSSKVSSDDEAVMVHQKDVSDIQ
ncbi:FKBP12-associated protein [Podila clonocystis]|nr:FKBP12-associated protein [Podila clonocystis]